SLARDRALVRHPLRDAVHGRLWLRRPPRGLRAGPPPPRGPRPGPRCDPQPPCGRHARLRGGAGRLGRCAEGGSAAPERPPLPLGTPDRALTALLYGLLRGYGRSMAPNLAEDAR